MTKVLIVDDEKLERFLICNSVEWEKNGFEIVGDAESGEEALKLFEIHRPDIVLTDIYMPLMSGLELAQNLLDKYGDVAVIIITGHRDFYYAQKALKIGVKDFILKPIDAEEVIRVCQKIRDVIDSGRLARAEVIQLKSDFSGIWVDAVSSFLSRLVSGKAEEYEALIGLEKYNLEFIKNEFICIRFRPNGRRSEEDHIKNALERVLPYKDGNKRFYAFFQSMGNCTILLKVQSLPEGDIKIILDELRNIIEEKACTNVEMGVSDIATGAGDVCKAYIQAEKALQACIAFGGSDKIFYYRSVEMICEENTAEGGTISDVDWKRFSFLLRNGLRDQLHEFIREYAKIYFKVSSNDPAILNTMASNLISAGTVVLHEMGNYFPEPYEKENTMHTIETVNQMISFLTGYIDRAVDYINGSRSKATTTIVGNAVNYIEENYPSPDLSLNSLAEYLYVNASYLSRIFKQMIGESITEYITRKRIEKSIELLNTTDLKGYEISERVGISDPHYFGICFKKVTGETIMTIRRQNRK